MTCGPRCLTLRRWLSTHAGLARSSRTTCSRECWAQTRMRSKCSTCLPTTAAHRSEWLRPLSVWPRWPESRQTHPARTCLVMCQRCQRTICTRHWCLSQRPRQTCLRHHLQHHPQRRQQRQQPLHLHPHLHLLPLLLPHPHLLRLPLQQSPRLQSQRSQKRQSQQSPPTTRPKTLGSLPANPRWRLPKKSTA